ncbi:MAG: hypothetical protein ABH803_04235 [Candidatus Micrarchaeota archaeon]
MVLLTCSFTFKHYGEIIKKALSEGYVFYSFNDYLKKKPSGKIFLLRHDVDNHFNKAKEFALIENSLGVKATYFFRVHAAYNLFEYNNFKDLRFIDESGHEIGLHAEVGDFDLFNKGIGCEELLRRDKAYLEACLGHKITGVAPHRDWDYQVNTLSIVEKMNLKEFGFEYHAYQEEFHGGVGENASGVKYLSETFKPHLTWREECPCKFVGKKEKICLMTHPAWWFHEHPRERE